MPVKKSLYAYNEEKHNCAQSILRGFQNELGIMEEQITEAKKHGGGRAEDGLCGALHSALCLAGNDEVKSAVRTAFVLHAGSEKCREIRKLGKVSCEECVRLAATLLHERLEGK